MEMAVNPGGAQQEFLGTRDVGSPDWHWDLGGTTYHFPCMSIDYNWDGAIDLKIEYALLLG